MAKKRPPAAAPEDPEDDDNESKRPQDSYGKHRKRQASKAKEESTEARDIGPIPAIVNAKRREACRLNLKKYLLTYFLRPHAFLAWLFPHFFFLSTGDALSPLLNLP